MKRILVVAFEVILFVSLYAQKNDEFLSTKFISGCPKEIEPLKKQFDLKNLSYANVETGIDSIEIVLGEMTQGKNNGYWISSYFNNKMTSFSFFSLEKETSSDYFSNKIDIKFDYSSQEFSLYVKYNPTTNEILYVWLAGDEKCDGLTFQKVDRLLDENKPLPELKLKTLTNENISTIDFNGKILVINWWATTCPHCRIEIPGLNKLVDKYVKNPDIVFLAIAFDKKERLVNYLNVNYHKYLQTFGDKEISEIFGESFPKNIIVNPDGIITYYSEGGNENTYQDLEKELLKQIN